jgi:NitT/TauT family transport system substrate-binding protein
MRWVIPLLALTLVGGCGGDAPAPGAATQVAIGISGWTGFAPLTLADEAGLFEKHGLDVTLSMIPQKDRHLAIASGAIQCAATTVETWIGWNAAGVETTQIFMMDRSHGADGLVVRPGITSIADLKGKKIAASAPGTAPYFTLAWILSRNGLSMSDVTLVTLEPAAVASTLLAGSADLDGGMTYEPYLSAVRSAPQSGSILATTLDYPVVMDTFGCTPGFLTEHPEAAGALAAAYFEALDRIEADPQGSFGIMGAAVDQTAAEFEQSQSFLRWQDRAANAEFFAGEHARFSAEAAQLLLELGIIRSIPDLTKLADPRFIQ